MKIKFDMDGTIANLYGVNGWLDDLVSYSARPFEVAEPLVNMSVLARVIHKLQAKGYGVGIISWTPPTDLEFYEKKVEYVKMQWLQKHLPSVQFDEILILPYKTPKENYAEIGDILFDDELKNREAWNKKGIAYDETKIFEILKELAK